MESTATPLVHIGYQKTAGSWMRNVLFNDPAGGFGWPFDRMEIKRMIAEPNSLTFDAERCRADLEAGLRRVAGRGLRPVLSSARLCGSPHAGGYDSAVVARRLAAVLPDARVLLIIRRQQDIILSSYRQYVHRGGRCSLRGYALPPRDRRIPLFDLDHFAYHRLIELYIELFGRENLLVLPYEELVTSGEAFASKILEFAGADRTQELPHEARVKRGGSRDTPVVTVLKRRMNVIAPMRKSSVNPQAVRLRAARPVFDNLHRFDSVVPQSVQEAIKTRWQRQIDDFVGDRYRVSNRATSELTDIDLAAYGYDL